MSNEVRINHSSINAFINEQPGTENKHVLYLKGGELKAVPIKETSLFERVLAWFGVGPLSLRNIATFIQNDWIDEQSNRVLEKAFAEKLVSKFEHYNESHTISKVNIAFIDKLAQGLSIQYSAVNTFSPSKGNSSPPTNLAYSDTTKGMACVIDLPSENSGEIGVPTESEVNTCLEAFQAKKFSSLDEAEAEFEEAVKSLGKYPNISLVQKVEIDGQWYLLSCYKGTTAFFIKHANGTVSMPPKAIGTGLNFTASEIERTDIIVGITDGYGSYITKKEMREILKQWNGETGMLEPGLQAIKTSQLRELNLQLSKAPGWEDLDDKAKARVKKTALLNTESANGKPATIEFDRTAIANTAIFILR